MVDNDRPPKKRRKRLKKAPDDARGFGEKFENFKFPFPKTKEKTSLKPTRSNGARSQPKMGTAQRNLTYSSVSDDRTDDDLYSELESDFDDDDDDDFENIDFENEEDLRRLMKKSTKSNNNNKTNNKSNNNNNKNKNKNNKNNKNNTGLQRPPVWSAEDFVGRGAKKTDDDAEEDLDEILKRSTEDRDEDAEEAEEDDRARLKRASELLESKVKKEPIWYGDVDSDSDSERREGLAEKPIVISDSDSDSDWSVSSGCEPLPPGTLITINGLKARQDLNGLDGIIVEFITSRLRYHVKVLSVVVDGEEFDGEEHVYICAGNCKKKEKMSKKAERKTKKAERKTKKAEHISDSDLDNLGRDFDFEQEDDQEDDGEQRRERHERRQTRRDDGPPGWDAVIETAKRNGKERFFPQSTMDKIRRLKPKVTPAFKSLLTAVERCVLTWSKGRWSYVTMGGMQLFGKKAYHARLTEDGELCRLREDVHASLAHALDTEDAVEYDDATRLENMMNIHRRQSEEKQRKKKLFADQTRVKKASAVESWKTLLVRRASEIRKFGKKRKYTRFEQRVICKGADKNLAYKDIALLLDRTKRKLRKGLEFTRSHKDVKDVLRSIASKATSSTENFRGFRSCEPGTFWRKFKYAEAKGVKMQARNKYCPSDFDGHGECVRVYEELDIFAGVDDEDTSDEEDIAYDDNDDEFDFNDDEFGGFNDDEFGGFNDDEFGGYGGGFDDDEDQEGGILRRSPRRLNSKRLSLGSSGKVLGAVVASSLFQRADAHEMELPFHFGYMYVILALLVGIVFGAYFLSSTGTSRRRRKVQLVSSDGWTVLNLLLCLQNEYKMASSRICALEKCLAKVAPELDTSHFQADLRRRYDTRLRCTHPGPPGVRPYYLRETQNREKNPWRKDRYANTLLNDIHKSTQAESTIVGTKGLVKNFIEWVNATNDDRFQRGMDEFICPNQLSGEDAQLWLLFKAKVGKCNYKTLKKYSSKLAGWYTEVAGEDVENPWRGTEVAHFFRGLGKLQVRRDEARLVKTRPLIPSVALDIFLYTEIQLLAFDKQYSPEVQTRKCAEKEYVYGIRNCIAVVVALLTGLRPKHLFSLLRTDVEMVRGEPLVISAWEDKRFDSCNEALANDFIFVPSNGPRSVNKRFKRMVEIWVKISDAADRIFLKQNLMFGGLVGVDRPAERNPFLFFPLCCEEELGVREEKRAQQVNTWLQSVLTRAISRERRRFLKPNGDEDDRSRITAYSLRKTTASLLFSAGLPVFRVEMWMHWSHTTRTSISSYISKNFGSPIHARFSRELMGDIVTSYSDEAVIESRHERYVREERVRRWQRGARN